MNAGSIGAMQTRGQGYAMHRFANWTWAADNECFARGQEFDLEKYLAWLDSYPDEAKATCLFATAPDVVGDAAATLARSIPTLARIREIGYKAAFVGQDGIEDITDQIPWDDFDAWFIGGSTEWKLSPAARALALEARIRGKWVHMGRVNSRRRFIAAATFCDSADGTFVGFGPDVNLPKVIAWVNESERQDTMF